MDKTVEDEIDPTVLEWFMGFWVWQTRKSPDVKRVLGFRV